MKTMPRHDLMPLSPEEKASHVGRTTFIACMTDYSLRTISREQIHRTKVAIWNSYLTSAERLAFIRGWRLEHAQFVSLGDYI